MHAGRTAHLGTKTRAPNKIARPRDRRIRLNAEPVGPTPPLGIHRLGPGRPGGPVLRGAAALSLQVRPPTAATLGAGRTHPISTQTATKGWFAIERAITQQARALALAVIAVIVATAAELADPAHRPLGARADRRTAALTKSNGLTCSGNGLPLLSGSKSPSLVGVETPAHQLASNAGYSHGSSRTAG